MRYDKKWIFSLAVIGIPAAHGLHGYVGFMYGSLKSREWWSSDLMPVIFLFSAIISGVALLVVLYVASCKIRRIPIDQPCIKGLAYTIWGFIMVAIVLEALAFVSLAYKAREGIEMIMQYVTGPLLVPYFLLQFAIGLFAPFLRLSYMIWRGTTGKALIVGVTVVRGAGAVLGLHDALERGDRRPGNLQDRQGPALLSPAVWARKARWWRSRSASRRSVCCSA